MEVPINVKRRYVEIDSHLDEILENRCVRMISKDGFVHTVCNSLSLWFLNQYLPVNNIDYYDSVESHKKIFIYFFREKILRFWEKNKP